MPRLAHKPTPETRAKVVSLASVGVPQEQLAKVLGIALNTLRKYYLEELETAEARANAQVAGALFRVATDTKHKNFASCAIFWMKTRAGWRETGPVEDPNNNPIAKDPDADLDD